MKCLERMWVMWCPTTHFTTWYLHGNRLTRSRESHDSYGHGNSVLNVKATTSNVMVYGECGILPPSVYCTVSTMCYMNRLHHMPINSIVKQVYNKLFKLHQMGIVTWVTRVGELVETYSINIDDSPASSNQNVNGLFSVNLRVSGLKMFKIFKEILSWELIVKSNRTLAWKGIWN